jgi:histidyl-tRNA synthetase
MPNRLVRPQTLRGFRDMLPSEMIPRNQIIERIRAVYERYGYVPLDTPLLEGLPTLVGSGGEEADKQIFQSKTPENQDIGLRFDLTVPFARVVAQYSPEHVKLPFRRYHIGPVFRADEPQPEQGRYRQFTQFDIDIAGTDSIAADAEIIAVVGDAFRAIGLEDDVPDDAPNRYFVRVNSRRVMDAFLVGVGVKDPDVIRHTMRVVDKRDKISAAALEKELGEGRVDESGDPIRGVGLGTEVVRAVLDFVGSGGGTRSEVVGSLERSIGASEEREAALDEVRLLCEHLDALGVPESAARLDPSLARGLDYYTGPVYEAMLPNAGVGSIMGGGRYDGLVNRFMDEPIAATGASIGLDRLVTGLTKLGLFAGDRQTTAEVLVLTMPGVPEPEACRVAAELRAAGIATEVYLGPAAGKVGRQLSWANARNMSVAVLLGESELADGTVAVKDLGAGAKARAGIAEHDAYRDAGSAGQRVVPRDELVPAVRGLLAGQDGT